MKTAIHSIIFLIASLNAWSQTTWHLQASYSYLDESHPHVIDIKLLDDNKIRNKDYPFVFNSSPALKDIRHFHVIQTKDNSSKEVEITSILLHPSSGGKDGRVAYFDLVLKEKPDPKGKYTVTVDSGTLTATVRNGDTVKPWNEPVKVDSLGSNDYPENDLSLKQGEDFGAVSLHYFQNVYLDDAKLVNLHLGLDVDASLNSPSDSKYLDKVEVEVGGYYANLVERDHAVLGTHGAFEVGFSSKMQADQSFDAVDETFGVNFWFWPINPVVESIANFSGFYDGDRGKPEYTRITTPPLVIIGYDYVAHLGDDPATADNGENRLEASLYWSLPVARKVEIKGVPVLDQIKQVNFISDISGVYDIDESKFSPEVNLSLDFALSTSEKMPTISFSWVNGKTAPKFEHFDAFLAGFKMKL